MKPSRPETVDPEIRLLLLSDDAAAVARIADWLSSAAEEEHSPRMAFSISEAASVRSALSRMAQRKFDLILYDLGRAENVQLELLRQIAEAVPRTAVLALAAEGSSAKALRAVQSGAQDLLAKNGLTCSELQGAIRLALARKQAEVQWRDGVLQWQSAHRRLERQAAELHAQLADLSQSRRALDDFTYMAAHDLKEPLLGISGSCEILAEDYAEILDAEGRRRLNALMKLCDRLAQRIADLLTICRIDRNTLRRATVDLSAVLKDVLKLLQPTIKRRRAAIHVHGSLPRVAGNATLISMVFSNLISNGLKFNDRHQPQVDIGALDSDPPTIYVQDNGIGIEERHFSDVFTLFRRLHGPHRFEGTGAGLTIVRKIIDAHGGRIWLESAVGAGTTVYLTLPTSESAASESTSAEDSSRSASEILHTDPLLRAPHWNNHAGAPRTAVRTDRN